MDQVAHIQRSIPGMVHPAVFRLGKIRKAIKLFVEFLARAFNQGRRLYPRGDGLWVMRSLEEFCKALFNAGLLGWWVTGVYRFLEVRGDYIYSSIDYERSASFFAVGDPNTSDARTIYSHKMRVGKPCISLRI
jgi:hypothetical protein